MRDSDPIGKSPLLSLLQVTFHPVATQLLQTTDKKDHRSDCNPRIKKGRNKHLMRGYIKTGFSYAIDKNLSFYIFKDRNLNFFDKIQLAEGQKSGEFLIFMPSQATIAERSTYGFNHDLQNVHNCTSVKLQGTVHCYQ